MTIRTIAAIPWVINESPVSLPGLRRLSETNGRLNYETRYATAATAA